MLQPLPTLANTERQFEKLSLTLTHSICGAAKPRLVLCPTKSVDVESLPRKVVQAVCHIEERS